MLRLQLLGRNASQMNEQCPNQEMGHKVVLKGVQDINRQRREDDTPGGINCSDYFESNPRRA